MKFRPQIQLRFRDADHYERVKAAAGVKDLSVNEYVLQAVEAFDGKPGGSYSKAVQRVEGQLSPGVRQDPDRGIRSDDDPGINPGGGEGNSQRGRGGMRNRTERPAKLQPVMSKSDQLKALRERNAR